jgi:U3 small nucleolar RNA-associated protein 24
MGRLKKARKCNAKRAKILSASDPRLKEKDRVPSKKELRKIKEREEMEGQKTEHVQTSSALFFQYNTQLGPPFHILVDTNFINFSISNKMDIIQNMMDTLYAKCIPYITDCVMGELETLGKKYRLALRIVRDPRFERLACMHKGIYADDCLLQRVTQHKAYIVATCDKELKSRIRKIPGVPMMYISNHRYTIERMPDAYGDPKA